MSIERPHVDLLLVGDRGTRLHWGAGAVRVCSDDPEAFRQAISSLASETRAEGLLAWDPKLGSPDPELLQALLQRPEDVWHAGLLLGMRGKPKILETVHPSWMFAVDPPIEFDATSWRLSFRACLFRSSVLKHFGSFSPGYRSLEAAGLELGHRMISQGAIMRHVPSLVSTHERSHGSDLPVTDELRFCAARFGIKWTLWAVARLYMGRRVKLAGLLQLPRTIQEARASQSSAPLLRTPHPAKAEAKGSVTVVVPTIDRYRYLDVLLGQLAIQTVPANQIIVVDQTPAARRDETIVKRFPDLPLEGIVLDTPGQCTSRNAAIQRATGDFILFLDDDDEIPMNLVEAHLETLAHFGAESSSGVAIEVGAGDLPEDFTFLRVSDVFPTNNTMVRKDALRRSGLFDLAYDRGQRADGDLGIRLYLSGSRMILNPSVSVIHHHAPAGGLRVHKARMITYAASRGSFFLRRLPSPTELYLTLRYFPPGTVTEVMWLAALGTLSRRGNWLQRLLRCLFGVVVMPHTVLKIRSNLKAARRLLESYPQIPFPRTVEAEPGGKD